jgi:hypothetical protein
MESNFFAIFVFFITKLPQVLLLMRNDDQFWLCCDSREIKFEFSKNDFGLSFSILFLGLARVARCFDQSLSGPIHSLRLETSLWTNSSPPTFFHCTFPSCLPSRGRWCRSLGSFEFAQKITGRCSYCGALSLSSLWIILHSMGLND